MLAAFSKLEDKSMENQEKKEKEVKKHSEAAVIAGILGALVLGTAIGVGTHSWVVGILIAIGSFLCITAVNCYIDAVVTTLSD